MGKQPVMDLQRLSEEVARDPASPAFLPLAQSYRRQGRYDAAIQLCIRALARNPSHLEGHALLAQLYLESGDQERAGDEWSIVLRLDPDHFEAHRGLGFYWLDRGRRRRHARTSSARRRCGPTTPWSRARSRSSPMGAGRLRARSSRRSSRARRAWGAPPGSAGARPRRGGEG